jgi:ABC-type glycerol-3-phosphate transport system permease component
MTLRSRRRVGIARTTFVVLLALAYLYPFAYMIGTAIKPRSEFIRDPSGLPTSATTEHIRQAWRDAALGRAILNSLTAVGIGVVVCLLVASLASFWFIRNTSRIARMMLGVFGSLWIVPQVIWLISFFILLSRLDLSNNLVVLGVVYGTVFTPTAVWLLWGYSLKGVPRELFEASSVDGARPFQQYQQIYLPLSMPALGSVAALTFVFAWGDLLLSVVLIQDREKYTVVTAAATLVGRFDAGTQATAAAAMLTMGPSLLVFLFAQRAIVRGITAGISK